MRKLFFISLVSLSLILPAIDSFAQCAMCRRVAETSQKGDSRKGLNAGIIYLLSIPYVMGGIGAVVWYKNRKK
jgi:hypothetical protein